MSTPVGRARSYNQSHAPRAYTPGRRRVSIYVSWSYPAESSRPVDGLDNRFSTMTEVRRTEWPFWEKSPWNDTSTYQQGIAGTLELFFRAFVRFQDVVEESTGHAVPVFQRIDQAGVFLPLDERILGDTDTLLVFGLDHMVTNQNAQPGEIEALKAFLSREGSCAIIGPHHDVGASDDLEVRNAEYFHHGDALVPRQQRFGTYGRELLNALDVPVENQYGLSPALVPGTRQIAPLSIDRDLDKRGWLEGVSSFNFHKHLPHYAVTREDSSVQVLARQPINPSATPHPFTDAGNTELNAFVWAPPTGDRVGDVLVADSTIFSTLFGGAESLETFWKNLAK